MPLPKILLTGAYGFIGSACLKAFKGTMALTALSRQPSEDFPDIPCIEQDITEPFTLNKEFDCVIHLAALNVTHVGKAPLEEYRKVQVAGTRNLLNAVKCKRFIYMSTAGVYKLEGKPIMEDSTVEPQNDYALSKYEGEQVCRDDLPDDKLVVIRSVNVTGEGQPLKALVPVLFNKAAHGEPLEIFSPKDTQLQLLHVDDAVNFIRLVVENDSQGIFNLSNSDKQNIEHVAERITALAESHSPINYTNNSSSSFSEVLHKRAEKELGWVPQYSIDQILERYSHYQRTS